LVFLNETVLIAGSIRAHRKEILVWNESGVKIPRTLHKVRVTVEGLVENASHCPGIRLISIDDQGSPRWNVPIFIALGKVFMHLGDDTKFEITNCARYRALTFMMG